MAKFKDEFHKSLKGIDGEEYVDTFFYRPLGFILAKLSSLTPITPNGISFLVFLTGLLTTYFFSRGTPSKILLGGILLQIVNVLDCADGQLARLKNRGNQLGRLIDGLVDYLVFFGIYLGIAIGLSKSTGNHWYWLVAILAGLSNALHSALFDNYRQRFIAYTTGEVRKRQDEYDVFSKKYSTASNLFSRILIGLYLRYTEFQQIFEREVWQESKDFAQIYSQKNRLLVRLWSFIGSSFHIVLVLIMAILERIDLYLWLTATVMNIYALVLYIVQWNHDRIFYMKRRK
ncbi:MAG: CDP-alcohol phosphatidyltransferase family protein [Candidatus Edwardsbacteria bacterium]